MLRLINSGLCFHYIMYSIHDFRPPDSDDFKVITIENLRLFSNYASIFSSEYPSLAISIWDINECTIADASCPGLTFIPSFFL